MESHQWALDVCLAWLGPAHAVAANRIAQDKIPGLRTGESAEKTAVRELRLGLHRTLDHVDGEEHKVVHSDGVPGQVVNGLRAVTQQRGPSP